ncbi:GMC oxidoreductase [Camillea tinctor]|nr:GMC oxidoreductase [Camillea tinctor]
MGLYTKLPQGIDEVDVIIAGGGTAGCVVAARLAEADPALSILMIEGGSNNESPYIKHPACFMTHLSPDSKTNNFYVAKKSPAVADRTLTLPAGGVLEGGSSTNMMMYSRPQRSDWDSWNAPGWSADDMVPYLKKLETYHGKDEKGIHGQDGPIHVSRGSYSSETLSNESMVAAKRVGLTVIEEDLSDIDSVNALWLAKRFISPDGKRQDAASCYLHPLLRDGNHSNLHVLVESQVARILLDENKRAAGVEFRSNPEFHPDNANPPLRSVKARRLVVASCGACATLSLLERSGIGGSEVLERAGVPVVVDLPGAEVIALGPEFKQAWDKEFRDYPDKPLGIINVLAGLPGDPRLATGDPSLAITAFTPYPFSRGHIHITGPKLGDPLDFETGFFEDAGHLDVKKHIWMYKKQREFIRRMPSYRGEMVHCHPPFAPESSAACIALGDDPLAEDVHEIEYSAADDVVLEEWLRENVSTTWHSLGTCKMLPRDQMGVVDPSLGVYGIQGLKIADLSIAPRNVAANTNDTALAVGEKAADIFIKELNLRSV